MIYAGNVTKGKPLTPIHENKRENIVESKMHEIELEKPSQNIDSNIPITPQVVEKIVESVEEKVEIVDEKVESVETKVVRPDIMDPSIMKAINNRRKSYNEKPIYSKGSHSQEMPSSPSVNKDVSLKQMNAITVKNMNLDIKNAIHARRKNHIPVHSESPESSKSPKPLRSATPKKKTSDEKEEVEFAPKVVLNKCSEFVQAINARRKSYNTSTTTTLLPLPTPTPAPLISEVNPVEVVDSIATSTIADTITKDSEPIEKTPMKKGTPSKTPKKISKSPFKKGTPSKESVEVVQNVISEGEIDIEVVKKVEVHVDVAVVATTNTPMRQAINIRSQEHSYTDAFSEYSVESSLPVDEVPFTGITIVIPDRRVHQFENSRVSRRMSVGEKEMIKNVAVQKRKSLG